MVRGKPVQNCVHAFLVTTDFLLLKNVSILVSVSVWPFLSPSPGLILNLIVNSNY